MIIFLSVQLSVVIILGVTFLSWIYRANKNLHALSSAQMAFTPGWSIGWYFVPVANLFKPYQAMKEIWHVAHRGESANHTILGWWWFLWVTSRIAGHPALILAFLAVGAFDYVAFGIAFILIDSIEIPLSVVTLILVRHISQAYDGNFVEQTSSRDGGGSGSPTLQAT